MNNLMNMWWIDLPHPGIGVSKALLVNFLIDDIYAFAKSIC